MNGNIQISKCMLDCDSHNDNLKKLRMLPRVSDGLLSIYDV